MYLCHRPDKAAALFAVVSSFADPSVCNLVDFTILKSCRPLLLKSSNYHYTLCRDYVRVCIEHRDRSGLTRVLYGGIFAGFHVAGWISCINYVAVYARLRVLALEGWESSQLYPIYSVGVVAVSTLLAMILFREQLSRQRTIGFAVGLIAVALLNQ